MLRKCYCKRSPNSFNLLNEKNEQQLLRQWVHRMYYLQGLNKSQIADRLGVSRPFVNKWTQRESMDFTEDHRGWRRGKPRKWNKQTEVRILQIHNYLQSNPLEFYSGASAVRQEWTRRYGLPGTPPLRTIGKIMKDLELTQSPKKTKNKGASRYLCYPEHSIYHLIGKRVLELDFIGKKFIEGRSAPLNFIAFCFKLNPRMRYFERISGEKGSEIIRCSEGFFKQFEKPDVIKMDNGFAMAGTAPQPGTLSQVPLWILAQKIIPIYAVPRKPFSQASIEGNNSVFSRKFWNKHIFNSPEAVDELLATFNDASLRYLGYQKPTESPAPLNFTPKVLFLRQVQLREKKAGILLASKVFELPDEYINYFVFAEWNLLTEQLTVFLEKDLKPEPIENFIFPINPMTKQKLIKKKII